MADPARRQIFISYRRKDTAYPADRLYELLTERFGDDIVFKDVDAIDLGRDFVEAITTAVRSCKVLLVLIGDRWLTSTTSEGQRRIGDPGIFVRLEIETALEHGVRVIPILFDGMKMPAATALPPGIAKLANLQALEVSANHFGENVSKLLKQLDKFLK